MANTPNKEEKLRRLKKVSSFSTGFCFFSSRISQKYANKCSEIILVEDFKDIANLLHVKTSHNWLYQLVKVSSSGFFY